MGKQYFPKTDRAALLDLAQRLRTEAGPKVAAMIDRLVDEAQNADVASSRVAAARAVIGFAVEGAKLAAELEAGGDGTSKQATGGVTVLVMRPDGEQVEPSSADMSAILDQLSASVRDEQAQKH